MGAEENIALGSMVAGKVLEHYGVKGMKWGIRKDRSPTAVETAQRPGQRVRATGGKNQSASEDAINAAVARRKARASTTDALSNKELQALVNRMNLEQQYARLSQGDQSAGVKLARAFLGDYGKTKFFQYADEAVNGNPDFPNMKPKPGLAPVVKSMKRAANFDQGGKKKNKN